MMIRTVLGACLISLWVGVLPGMVTAGESSYTREQDVIYGRKFGTALTMDVFTPKKDANGVGLIWVVSGGWFSSHEGINIAFLTEFLERGYTVFAVVHGSQPKFTIREILGDMHRAVRFIRAHAKQYHIDPTRIGIMGGSAGGHLSLMQAMAGTPGDPKARDAVDRVSSRVQAVGCFFPPTDFLNYGKPGENALGRGILKDFRAPFDFREYDKKQKRFERIRDETVIMRIGREISPITHVTADDPPTLIIHGDADRLVPIQQARTIVAKLKKVGVPAKLVVKPGAGHGWPDLVSDMPTIADWFDEYLCGEKPKAMSRESTEFPSELADFVPYQQQPIFNGTGKDTWDAKIRERGYILREDSQYHMWYTGYNERRSDTKYLGYATSPDGIHWTRYSGNPIFAKSWVEDMCVVKHDGVYYMFAEGRHDIAHWLTSTDRIHWQKYPGNPIVTGNKDSGILVNDGHCYRLYTMHPGVRLFFPGKFPYGSAKE